MKTYTYTLFGGLIAIILVGAGCFSAEVEVEMDDMGGVDIVDDSNDDIATDELFVDGTYGLDVSQSSAVWSGSHFLGDERVGTVETASGSVVIASGMLDAATFTMDMTTIEAELGARLTDHLKNEDFFEVETYPEATFELTSVEPVREGEYKVTGDFTIKGITQTQDFEVALMQTDDETLWATATIVFDRTRWDIQYGSTAFFSLEDLGDSVLDDEFTLKLDLIFTAE